MFNFKNEIDQLRMLYYDFFHKAPSINPVSLSVEVMFGDSTLPIYTEGYLIKGEIPFRIKFTENYSNNQPDEKYSIGIQVNKNDLSKEIAREYLKFMATLIRKYSNNAINFICCDGFNKAHNFSNCPLAYIGENGFFKNHTTKEKAYYEFFERLCDNNWRILSI